jgi:hypothetical protein
MDVAKHDDVWKGPLCTFLSDVVDAKAFGKLGKERIVPLSERAIWGSSARLAVWWQEHTALGKGGTNYRDILSSKKFLVLDQLIESLGLYEDFRK